MLSNAARFACGDVGFSYSVQNGSFTVVDVTHNGNDGRTCNEISRIFRFVEVFGQHVFRALFQFKFEFYAEIVGDERRGVEVDRIVNGFHNAFFEKAFGDFRRGDTDFFAQYF